MGEREREREAVTINTRASLRDGAILVDTGNNAVTTKTGHNRE